MKKLLITLVVISLLCLSSCAKEKQTPHDIPLSDVGGISPMGAYKSINDLASTLNTFTKAFGKYYYIDGEDFECEQVCSDSMGLTTVYKAKKENTKYLIVVNNSPSWNKQRQVTIQETKMEWGGLENVPYFLFSPVYDEFCSLTILYDGVLFEFIADLPREEMFELAQNHTPKIWSSFPSHN